MQVSINSSKILILKKRKILIAFALDLYSIVDFRTKIEVINSTICTSCVPAQLSVPFGETVRKLGIFAHKL